MGSRPISKFLTIVQYGTITDVQQQTTILPAQVAAGTAASLRWSLHCIANDDTLTFVQQGFWAVILRRESEAVDGINLNNGNGPYTPEEDVLAFGTFGMEGLGSTCGPAIFSTSGTSTAQRKMKVGDTIEFVIKGREALRNWECFGCFQIFFKK